MEDVIKMFLEGYGIKDGQVKIGDSNKSFSELDKDLQLKILTNVVNSKKSDSLDLTNDEIQAVNFLREKKTNLNDFLNEEVGREVLKATNHYEMQSEDFKKMSDDLVYKTNLKSKNPDLTDDELERKLVIAKESDSFKEVASDIRDVMITAQDVKIEKAKREAKLEDESTLELERKEIVNEVIPIDKIDDWPIGEEEKDDLLEKILEVEDNGKGVDQPVFINEITADPEKLLTAAHRYYGAKGNYDKLEQHYRLKVAEAKAEGKKDAFVGTEVDKDRIAFEVNDNKKAIPGEEKHVPKLGEE